MKKKCAQKALEMIENGMIVGLGGGSTVALLIEEIEKHRKRIQAVTPSRDVNPTSTLPKYIFISVIYSSSSNSIFVKSI